MGAQTAVLTGITLFAFAANSVLCRLALGAGAIDAASFTAVRLVSGALMLLGILALKSQKAPGPQGSWASTFWLALYAITFSYAYLSLSAGTGALILFGAVQATMIGWALRAGERPGVIEWVGLVVALSGVVYLVLPGVTAPSPVGSALMALAGVGWGFYSLRGRGAADPLGDTARNFVRSVPLVVAALGVALVAPGQEHVSMRGVMLAVASGALASGVGYAVWYTALRGLTATRAAIVQLAVPVIAAFGGVIFAAETITLRLAVSSALILGGVGAATLSRKRACPS